MEYNFKFLLEIKENKTSIFDNDPNIGFFLQSKKSEKGQN